MITEIYYQNQWVDPHAKVFDFSNRGIKYGDGFFESMRVFNNQFCFLKDHLERAQTTAEILGFDLRKAGFTKAMLETSLQTFLSKHQINNCAVRIQFFRTHGNKYTPLDSTTTYYIEFTELNQSKYSEVSAVEEADIFKKHLIPKGSLLSALKTSNSLIYVLAKQYCTSNNLGDTILLNTERELVEFSSSNLYIDTGDKILTPPLSSGCLDGIIRRQLLKPTLKNKFNIIEANLKEKDLKKATAIYGSNTSTGIFYINKIGNQTFEKGAYLDLLRSINQSIS